MALLDIHLLGSPVLRATAAEIVAVDDATREFIDSLYETMDAAEGVGLAANQVGVTTRVAVIDADGQRFVMVNPKIVLAMGRDKAEEGCLSIPEVYADVTRAAQITLEAQDRDGAAYRLEAGGLVARAIQHEIDHLDGILFLDHLSPLKRQVMVARYRREHRGESLTRSVAPPSSKRS
ncbi:MAG: peptide deformylase [Gemmatimonadota bacterium]|nr:peptide deformylase [Gemmatimonadota bacterium]